MLPACLGVKVKVALGLRLPESKVLPSSAVTVCSTAPILVQVIVSPTLTGSAAGSKRHSCGGLNGGSTMCTIAAPAAGAAVGSAGAAAVAAGDMASCVGGWV